MIRPEQISNVKFTPVTAGTYNSEEVDAFVREVAAAYSELTDQNATLIKKMGILAEKVESYRNDEEAIKNALLDAHKLAESVTKNAEAKSTGMITDAETKAKAIKDDAEKNAADLAEAARLQAGDIVNNARTAVASLKDRAQQEADRVVESAKAKASDIINSANKESEQIVGNSKKEYSFYSTELEKVRAEMLKFRTMVEDLCNGKTTIPEVAAEVDYAKKEEADPAEAKEETAEPEIDAPEVPAAPAESIDEIFDSIMNDAENADEPQAPATEEPAEVTEPAAAADDAAPADDNDIAVLFDLLDDADDEPADDFASDIDDLFPEPQIPGDPEPFVGAPAPVADGEDDDDLFDDILGSMDDDKASADNDDDDDITSLFDSLFD